MWKCLARLQGYNLPGRGLWFWVVVLVVQSWRPTFVCGWKVHFRRVCDSTHWFGLMCKGKINYLIHRKTKTAMIRRRATKGIPAPRPIFVQGTAWGLGKQFRTQTENESQTHNNTMNQYWILKDGQRKPFIQHFCWWKCSSNKRIFMGQWMHSWVFVTCYNDRQMGGIRPTYCVLD